METHLLKTIDHLRVLPPISTYLGISSSDVLKLERSILTQAIPQGLEIREDAMIQYQYHTS